MQSDEQLLARIAEKDRAAFSAVMDRHLENVRKLAWRMLQDETAADDIAQDVFLKVWQSPEKYDPAKAKFSTWLYRVTTNASLDAQRRSKSRAHDALDENHADGNANTEAELAERQQARQVHRAIEDLPERQRAAILLSHFHQRSNDETARILETSIEAVESLLGRARRSLRAKLRDTLKDLRGK